MSAGAKVIDMVGVVCGRLTVLERDGHDYHGRAVWLCRCMCGATTSVVGKMLRSGNTKSCGCLRAVTMSRVARASNTARGHGWRNRRSYSTWQGMVARCHRTTHASYAGYGGRGITVCDRWRGPGGYGRFIADMGEQPAGLTLDRVNSNGPYSPENCRWATWEVQSRNRGNNVWVEFNGERLIVSDWAAKLGVPLATLRHRLKSWGVDRALTSTPTLSGATSI